MLKNQGGRPTPGVREQLVFESTTSTNSITPAGMYGKQMLLYRLHHKNASLFSSISRNMGTVSTGCFIDLPAFSRMPKMDPDICSSQKVYNFPPGIYKSGATFLVGSMLSCTCCNMDFFQERGRTECTGGNGASSGCCACC